MSPFPSVPRAMDQWKDSYSMKEPIWRIGLFSCLKRPGGLLLDQRGASYEFSPCQSSCRSSCEHKVLQFTIGRRQSKFSPSTIIPLNMSFMICAKPLGWTLHDAPCSLPDDGTLGAIEGPGFGSVAWPLNWPGADATSSCICLGKSFCTAAELSNVELELVELVLLNYSNG